jgi:hypothetical protein
MKATAFTKAVLAAMWVPGLILVPAACGNSVQTGAVRLEPRPSVTATTHPATPGASTAAAPSADAAVEVYGDCTSPSLEPTVIVLACADDGWVLQDIVWTGWTSTAATGVATLVYKPCIPSCAEGGFRQVPDTQLTLTDPVPDIAGQLVWSRLTENPWPPGYTKGPLHGAPYPLPTRPI